jgi:BlaR1 peptidase M56
LLPAAVVVGLTPQQLEALVAHELAHVRRHDYFVNILQMIVETFLFYHPVVWWVSSRIRYERELCCDDLAVRSCGSVVSYARALAQLERLRTTGPTLAMGSADGPLFHRIQRLLGRGSAENGPSKLVCAMGLLVGVLSLAFFMSDARAQQEKSVPAVLQQLETVLQELETVVPPSSRLPPLPAAPPVQPLTVLPASPPAPAPIVVPPPAPTAPARPARPVAPAPVAPGTLAPVAPMPTLPPTPWLPQGIAPQVPLPAPAPPTPSIAGLALPTATRVPWVLFRGDRMSVRDTTAEEVEAARRARQSFTGNLLWFQVDGKAYVTQDPETINQVLASAGSSDRLNLNRAQHEQVEAQLNELRDRLSRVSRAPENTQSIEDARRQLDSLRAENVRLQAMLQRLEEQLLTVEKNRQWEADSARDLEVLRGAVRGGKAQAVP